MQNDNTGDDEDRSDEMHEDGFLVEFFATESWPDDSKQNAKKENYDWRSGIGGNRCNGDSWSECKSGTVSKILGNANDCINYEWAEHFAFGFFDDRIEALNPGWFKAADDNVTNTFTEEDKNHVLNKRHLGDIAGSYKD